MKVHYGLQNIEISNSTAVTTGTFDGVHLGHEKILKSLVEESKENNLESVVLTFWPHPRNVLRPENPLFLLSSLQEKIDLLGKYQIDHLVVIEFTQEFSQVNSKDFLSEIIESKLKTKLLIIGYDHRFGKNQEGSFDYIKNNQNDYTFDIKEIECQDVDSLTVSSTEIRKALQIGDVHNARKLLGYKYTLGGKVVLGNQIGRKMNFPTANIDLELKTKLIPQDGVYTVSVLVNSKVYYGMLNIGVRPTIDSKNKTIEVHIFDFDQDIYGKDIKVAFIAKIRDERKFNGLDELQKQLKEDQLSAIKIIENEKIRN